MWVSHTNFGGVILKLSFIWKVKVLRLLAATVWPVWVWSFATARLPLTHATPFKVPVSTRTMLARDLNLWNKAPSGNEPWFAWSLSQGRVRLIQRSHQCSQPGHQEIIRPCNKEHLLQNRANLVRYLFFACYARLLQRLNLCNKYTKCGMSF